MNKAWQLYIVQTAAGVLYTGITTDVARRVEQHESGRGAPAPRRRRPPRARAGLDAAARRGRA
ncbi:GIY-YIG nuclease family protein, partial [Pantoea piersonii]|uniref:GIY-YIG nuclease family protein n=1 Tax=Pantoea piersonii TaxID=2364647 RepID=UPI001D5DA495